MNPMCLDIESDQCCWCCWCGQCFVSVNCQADNHHQHFRPRITQIDQFQIIDYQTLSWVKSRDAIASKNYL